MGDLGHPLQEINCRKRKADTDEDAQHPISQSSQSPSDPILVDRPSSPLQPSHAPRQPPTSPWLSTDTAHAVWPSEHSPTDSPPVSPLSTESVHARFHKRPRIDTKTHPRTPDRHLSSRASLPPPTPTRRSRRREPLSPSPSSPQPPVLRIEPHLPSAGSLHPALQPPFPHIDLASPHIPSLHPLINRQTLKELDLSAILRNPQLRTSASHAYYSSAHSSPSGHDLLFDAGLQFRPTSGRKKRELSDKYWRAVAQEFENGCTCISFDMQWRPSDCACVCRRVPLPSQNPVLTYSTSHRVLTLRMPSRIRSLLTEFLEVLLFVIQPLTSISDTYANPSTFQAQIERHAAQAAHLRSVFDPELIHQELQHNLFDPSGLFIVIGQTLKSHCAPMRDRAVDAMVEVAKACAPGGGGSKADAVRAVRMCLDILELMKLDIANHQLQTLRPFLIDSSGQYELKAFKSRRGLSSSLDVTRDWIKSSHRQLLASPIFAHPSFPSGSFNYSSLSHTQKTYVSVLKGLTDLVFNPPSPAPSTPQCSSSATVFQAMCPLPLYPETTYLDSARLLALAVDAADTAAMYMFLLLYRQLVFSDTGDLPCVSRDQSRVSDTELLKLKKEIRDIASSHLGQCFKFGSVEQSSIPDVDREKWSNTKQDIVLQVALRAKEAQAGSSSGPHSADGYTPHFHAPDERMLKLAERWSETHVQPNSALGTMLKNRIRDAVFSQVLAVAYPPRGSLHCHTKAAESGASAPSNLASGMEPLADEIRSLAERLSRLAHIHLGVYLPLYEQEDILSAVTTPFT
ncbi:Tcp11-domain-containing protein [Boletus edulis BED1]|uniref:Tcp11-domain-containing protein n=1 Tax=Boletus edulis BED1 TaxID=1328754 RepID=A0AAD4GHJ0_BOLED|nr:Tcp11-domain-containing protein [Boletus edulis BED1]